MEHFADANRARPSSRLEGKFMKTLFQKIRRAALLHEGAGRTDALFLTALEQVALFGMVLAGLGLGAGGVFSKMQASEPTQTETAAGVHPQAQPKPAIDEEEALKRIELLGGKVTRDEKLPGRPVIGVDFSRA